MSGTASGAFLGGAVWLLPAKLAQVPFWLLPAAFSALGVSALPAAFARLSVEHKVLGVGLLFSGVELAKGLVKIVVNAQ